MARDAAVHLTALCAVVAFLWTLHAFEKHELLERPRLSSVLLLAIAGSLCFVAGYFSSWLPGGNGRFDQDTPLQASKQPAPKRPRRYFFPVLVVCVLLRLELFYYVSSHQQCSSAGVESFLCLLLVCYETYSVRRPRVPPPDDSDPWGSLADDLARFFSGWTAALTDLVAVLALCDGTFLAVSSSAPPFTASYLCAAAVDGGPGAGTKVLAAQVIGLFLDAVVALLVWRVLAWARTTKARLSTLGSALLVAALAAALTVASGGLFGGGGVGGRGHRLPGPDALYALHVLTDGAALGVLVIAASLVASETTPAAPASVMTLVVGVPQALRNVGAVGGWQHLSRLEAVLPLYLCTSGFVVHLYVRGIRSVVFFRRAFLVLCLLCLGAYATIAALTKPTVLVGKHPLSRTIYDARVAHDRWARQASMSMRPEVAADEYRRRYGGRDPPAGFDKWFAFARSRKSPVLDRFDQIAEDMLPWWGLEPAEIRERVARAQESDFVASLVVKDRRVSHSDVPDPSDARMLDRLVSMVAEFAENLPDMVVPINLQPMRPRMLPTWDEKQRLISRATTSGLFSGAALTKRGINDDDTFSNLTVRAGPASSSSSSPSRRQAGTNFWSITSPADFGRIHTLVCPPGSHTRSGPAAWDDQFLTDHAAALDVCAQPDLAHLHGFYTTYPSYPAAFRDLVPLFSAAKTSAFADILIPLPEPEALPEDKDQNGGDGWKNFFMRRNSLYWRAVVDPNYSSATNLGGNHVHRLLHMINNASSASDTATVLLPQSARSSTTDRFAYTSMTLRAATAALPLDMGLGSYLPCQSPHSCDATTRQFGLPLDASDETTPPPSSSSSSSSIHDNRFILLLDPPTTSHPPISPTLLQILRSPSAPILSTIFKTWSTERLAAWVHFIPLDTRLHGFHSTAAYFLGMRGPDATRDEMLHPHHHALDALGRDPRAVGDLEDGEWIAGRGRAWAASALREEDRKVYLFRLLLEWGRVGAEGREGMGYKGSLGYRS